MIDALGTIGGSAARPEDALEWRDRCAAATLPSAKAVAPAVVALVAIAAEMNAGAKLAVLWASLRAFVAAHVIAPRAMDALIDQLDAAVRALAADRVTVDVVGVAAMQLIAGELVAMRLRSGRFGEPAIYVGTILEAAGLPFRAVRILGIAEGMFPRTLRDDALLPSDLRLQLPLYSISSDADFAALQLHAFDHVVRGVRDRLVISTPRTDVEGSEREPAALFIEIAAALARPDASTGQRAAVIPNRNDLERDGFRPARTSGSARRADTPLTVACWLDRVARGEGGGPRSWSRSAIIDPAAIAARRVTMYGDLGTTALTKIVPGLEPTLPISASKLQDLLTCPHRFLLAHILRFRARSTGAENHRIDALTYGALVHRLAERFWRMHGAAFGARERSVDHWRRVAAELADAEFDELLTRYPLVGHGVIAAERRRLHRDTVTLIDHDWDGGRPRAFVDVERSFGLADDPLSVPTAHGPLYVTGRIDRLDVDQGIALVRDVKTGKAHPRERDEADAQVRLDLQLAVYSVVAEQTAPRDDRGQAVHERARNVIVDASAGTGKTSLVVERIVSLIAPHDGRDPVPIDRIAAITFTRKAAGELRVRTRQQILTELATVATEAPRAQSLHRALAGIDTAQIGTIHGFADRLLRLWPAQARLDPRYELDDDVDRRVEECFQLLLHGAETSTLVDSLRGSPAEPLGAEATATILDAQRAGLRTRSLETEHWTYHGLDGLVAGFVHHRDASVPEVAPVAFDHAAFDRFSHEYLGLIDGLSSETRGGRWLLETGELLRRARQEPDPVVRFREVVEWIERGPRGRASDKPSKKHDFGGDARAWDIWKIVVGDDRKKPLRDAALRDDLLSPLRRWFAIRLARLRPVVLHIYEQVKARHQVVDHIDLLLRLRDLLRGDLDIRRSCQQMFDHLFVDEFQDTDPLQAEIVMFLCEQGTDAATWEQVTLSPGRLTIVGDPKQSIYRFRRADIATYQRVVEIVERSPHLTVQLSASYRSAPRLVEWLNARFVSILGHGDPGERFRHRTGEVFHQPLTAGRTTGSETTVHAVPFDLPEQGLVADSRALEAEAMARYMRWLVRCSGVQIADPVTGEPRSIGFGDIGVLAMTTTQLHVLFDALDRDDVPYAARGGAVFLADPLQKHFLLGLCALADRDDGVALAAILRPPFLAVDLGDLARARDDDPDDRASQARAIVRELRRRRFERGPGATARALLEETGFGRMIALGPNGSQRLSSIRELCFQVEARALRDRLDFDGTMEQLRDWIDRPPRIGRPPPVAGEAVRIMTVHQAKGLEFPVVVLWDACATWKEPVTYDPWSVDRDGRGWSMRLDTLRWGEPADLGILAVEHTLRQQERKRLVYVAATRARDLLVIPQICAPDDGTILGTLVLASSPTVLLQPLHTAAVHATWFDAAAPAAACAARESSERDVELRRELDSRLLASSQPLMRPSAFTDAGDPRSWWGKQGRYGRVFGETVHLAIGFALQRGAPADEAVRDAASRTGLSARLAEAVADTTRALCVLATLGLAADGQSYAVEYPIAGLTPGGGVVAGYIDLVAGSDEGMVILDFKTDTPPSDCQPPSPRYVEQVTGYAAALRRALDVTAIRAGLLFTADGSIHWLSSGDNASV